MPKRLLVAVRRIHTLRCVCIHSISDLTSAFLRFYLPHSRLLLASCTLNLQNGPRFCLRVSLAHIFMWLAPSQHSSLSSNVTTFRAASRDHSPDAAPPQLPLPALSVVLACFVSSHSSLSEIIVFIFNLIIFVAYLL